MFLWLTRLRGLFLTSSKFVVIFTWFLAFISCLFGLIMRNFMLMVILQKMHAITTVKSNFSCTKSEEEIAPVVDGSTLVSGEEETGRKIIEKEAWSLEFSLLLWELRLLCEKLDEPVVSLEELWVQRSLSTWFFVTPCILGAALGWSYDDQRMAERVSVVKKSRLCFSSFLASLSPKALFYMRRVSGFSLLYTKLWKKKTRSQLLFCFLKNSNRRQKVFHSYIFLGL